MCKSDYTLAPIRVSTRRGMLMERWRYVEQVTIQRECDVLVLGGGFAGSVCAAISAKMGHSTVLVDVGEHPRVSVGESTTPEWNASMYFLGCRYGIPELVDLASYPRIKGCRLPRLHGSCGASDTPRGSAPCR